MASITSEEIESQPCCWREVANVATGALPAAGQRVAAVGCGTSWYMAQAYAAMREAAGFGETDAFAGSEFPIGRAYDAVVVICRSGTTTEIVDLLAAATSPTVVITAVPGSPVVAVADQAIELPFADEKSVVQTRFATTVLALLRANLGADLDALAAAGEEALAAPLAESWIDAEQISFLGTGWSYGLANEAGLKLREASQSWVESYLAMEYRHGPIAIAQPGRLVWVFGEAPAGLADQVAATGAEFVADGLDPMASLVIAQRLAVARAEAKGLDPDAPRSLTRSVILS